MAYEHLIAYSNLQENGNTVWQAATITRPRPITLRGAQRIIRKRLPRAVVIQVRCNGTVTHNLECGKPYRVGA